MSIPAQRIQGSKSIPDVERQINVALERLQLQVNKANSNSAATPAMDAQVAANTVQITNLTNLSGSDLATGGTGTPAPATRSGGSSFGTVRTDGVTISGDGNSTPIFLDTPVTIANGGTGTATPALVPGSNISITGAWPDQTIAFAFTFADSEVPSGLINGANTAYTLAHTPVSTVHVYRDGLRTLSFTQVGTALTMGTAPTTSLVVDYRY